VPPDGRKFGGISLGILMDASAPAVVAVVITRDPGPWLEDHPTPWPPRDYPQLAVLVVAARAGSATRPLGSPGCSRTPSSAGSYRPLAFGAAANEVLGASSKGPRACST